MQGFEIDTKAFRAQNVGRPPEHLIREAIQNAFDAGPSTVDVTIRPDASGRGVEVCVADNGPGFKDEKEIWTIFASGKRDDCTKRGRLGRGLKELISVCSHAAIETAGKRITFAWNGKTLTRSVRKATTSGTKITATVPGWSRKDIERIVAYLRTFIAPDGTTMFVNGEANRRPEVERSIRCCLPTVIFNNDGVPKETWRHTDIRLLHADGDRWIFEMGIPVEKILDEDGFGWSIDVGQRTPLRPERDMLPRSYVHALYAYVANELVDQIPQQELTALWMEEAVGNHNFEKATKGKVYVERRFGQNAARAVVADPHDRNVTAQEHGVNVVHTAHVSASVRDILTQHLRTTADLYPVKCAEARFIPQDDWTEGEQRFVAFGKWLAAEMNLSVPSITIYDAPLANCEADSCASGTRIRLNRSGVGTAFFSSPRLANWIPLIVHELAHRTGNGHDAVFWREVERLAGEAAEVVHRSPERASEFLAAPAEVVLVIADESDTPF